MYNILICDDQPDIVNALKIYLKPEGYTIFTAGNGLEALECLRKNDIHLVLLDVMMPQMDGITAVTRIRTFSNVPVILLTAKSETEDMVEGLGAGADDYITKPFVPAEVLARVRSQLRRYDRLGSRMQSTEELRVGSITLNDTAVLSGGHDDRGALLEEKDAHWGWLLKAGFNVIQTDFPQALSDYICGKK